LAPADTSGCGNVCPWSTEGCRAACLNTAGRGGILKKGKRTNAIQRARKARTRLFFKKREAFLSKLFREIEDHARRASVLDLLPAVRLNGTSDLAWECIAPFLFSMFPGVQFYDYTKSASRAIAAAHGDWPSNYSLTYSKTEKDSWDGVFALLGQGVSVAVVARVPMPEGINLCNEDYDRVGQTVDGDKDDLRFLDPKGSLVYLKAKGKAKKDTSGFVV
jgi:hypothetical protein